MLVLGVVLPGAAAERSVVVLTPTEIVGRMDATREAIGFWNAVLRNLGLETRLGEPRIVVASHVERRVENYARQISQRAVRLPAGDSEADPPKALTSLDADIVVLLWPSGHHVVHVAPAQGEAVAISRDHPLSASA